jgi:hypothetical protein
MTVIGLATCAAFPDGDPDDAHLVAALPEARFAIWDDPAVDWSVFDLVVIRSTWDYQERRDQFLDWVRSVPRIINPPEIVEWNTDKRYLGELGRVGIQIVHTDYVEPGEEFAAPVGEYVIKPTVSAGSRHPARFAPREEARAPARGGGRAGTAGRRAPRPAAVATGVALERPTKICHNVAQISFARAREHFT